MSEAAHRKRLKALADELVWAGMGLRRAVSLRSRFVPRTVLERELRSRGYELTQDTKGLWFGMPDKA